MLRSRNANPRSNARELQSPHSNTARFRERVQRGRACGGLLGLNR